MPPAAPYALTTPTHEPAGSLLVTPAPDKLGLPRVTMRVLAHDALTHDVVVGFLAPESALSLAIDLGTRFNLFPAARAAVGSVWRLAPEARTATDGPVLFAPDVTRVLVCGDPDRGDVLVSALNGSGDVRTQYVCYAYLLPLPEQDAA